MTWWLLALLIVPWVAAGLFAFLYIRGCMTHEEISQNIGDRLSNIADSVDGLVWEFDPNTMLFTYVSRQVESMLGYPPEQWYTEPNLWWERMHPEDRDWAYNY